MKLAEATECGCDAIQFYLMFLKSMLNFALKRPIALPTKTNFCVKQRHQLKCLWSKFYLVLM